MTKFITVHNLRRQAPACLAIDHIVGLSPAYEEKLSVTHIFLSTGDFIVATETFERVKQRVEDLGRLA